MDELNLYKLITGPLVDEFHHRLIEQKAEKDKQDNQIDDVIKDF